MGDFSVDEIEPCRGYIVRPRVNNAKPVYLNINQNSIHKMLLKANAIQEHFSPKIKFVSPVADKIVNITIIKQGEIYSIGDYEIDYDLKNFDLIPLNFDPRFEPMHGDLPCVIDRNTNKFVSIKTVHNGWNWLINNKT